jgi:hypothetical protein
MRRSRGGRALAIAAGGIAVLGIGTVVGLLVGNRLKTGTWSVPTGNDLIRIDRIEEAGPPRVIYLHRGPITLTGGDDDAARRMSSVVASAGRHSHHQSVEAAAGQGPAPDLPRVVMLRGFRGTTRSWTSITRCVAKLFSPFDVQVTDVEPPAGTPYVMAVVGGRPKDVGHPHRVGGLAPFNGNLVPGAVVFAFADELRNDTRATCEVISMEVAHAFGLDHAHACPDVMTYLQGCGKKAFRDIDAECGEKKPRPCHGGARTQNSYRHLLEVLGPRKAPVPAAARSPASD